MRSPKIQVNPCPRVTLDNISWSGFEAILKELGEHRHSHIAYYQGVLAFRKDCWERMSN